MRYGRFNGAFYSPRNIERTAILLGVFYFLTSFSPACAGDVTSKTSATGMDSREGHGPLQQAGQALRKRLAEAYGIGLQLGRDSLNAKQRLPGASSAFEQVLVWLTASPPKRGEYGGGLLPRLDAIHRDIAASLQDRDTAPADPAAAKLPAWQAAMAGRQRFIQALGRAHQLREQVVQYAKQEDIRLRDAGQGLWARNQKQAALDLDQYRQQVQRRLAAILSALDQGLKQPALAYDKLLASVPSVPPSAARDGRLPAQAKTAATPGGSKTGAQAPSRADPAGPLAAQGRGGAPAGNEAAGPDGRAQEPPAKATGPKPLAPEGSDKPTGPAEAQRLTPAQVNDIYSAGLKGSDLLPKELHPDDCALLRGKWQDRKAADEKALQNLEAEFQANIAKGNLGVKVPSSDVRAWIEGCRTGKGTPLSRQIGCKPEVLNAAAQLLADFDAKAKALPAEIKNIGAALARLDAKCPGGACTGGKVRLPSGGCGCPEGTTPDSKGECQCTKGLVRRPDGRCGCPDGSLPDAKGQCPCGKGLVRLPDGSCGQAPDDANKADDAHDMLKCRANPACSNSPIGLLSLTQAQKDLVISAFRLLNSVPLGQASIKGLGLATADLTGLRAKDVEVRVAGVPLDDYVRTRNAVSGGKNYALIIFDKSAFELAATLAPLLGQELLNVANYRLYGTRLSGVRAEQAGAMRNILIAEQLKQAGATCTSQTPLCQDIRCNLRIWEGDMREPKPGEFTDATRVKAIWDARLRQKGGVDVSTQVLEAAAARAMERGGTPPKATGPDRTVLDAIRAEDKAMRKSLPPKGKGQ